MIEGDYRLSYQECLETLVERLKEPGTDRIQLLCGPRQVGKTTLLLELADRMAASAVYVAADSPEATVPGFWERLWRRVEEMADRGDGPILLLDEVHMLDGWASRLKGEWDRQRRRKRTVKIVATGSSALRLATGSPESLAGRFERLTLVHWSASSLAAAFHLSPHDSAEALVRMGSYPGAFSLGGDLRRWSAYVRDSILEPAVGRDILAVAPVRRPALLRQVFGVAASSPAQIVSLQKIQGQLQDKGALETIAHYLALLEDAFLVAALPKHSRRGARSRAAPPKLVTLDNALLAVTDPQGAPDRSRDPARYGAWVGNACLSHAWNRGQRVTYWREEPFEIDAVLDGSWGRWAVEVKTGKTDSASLGGLLEFTRRNPEYRPLVLAEASDRKSADRSGIAWMDWRDFLCGAPGPRA